MSTPKENILHWLQEISTANPFSASVEVAAEVSNNPQLLSWIIEDFSSLATPIKVVLLFSIPCLRKKAYDDGLKGTSDQLIQIAQKDADQWVRFLAILISPYPSPLESNVSMDLPSFKLVFDTISKNVKQSPSFISLEKAYLDSQLYPCDESRLTKMKLVERNHFSVKATFEDEQKSRFEKLRQLSTNHKMKSPSPSGSSASFLRRKTSSGFLRSSHRPSAINMNVTNRAVQGPRSMGVSSGKFKKDNKIQLIAVSEADMLIKSHEQVKKEQAEEIEHQKLLRKKEAEERKLQRDKEAEEKKLKKIAAKEARLKELEERERKKKERKEMQQIKKIKVEDPLAPTIEIKVEAEGTASASSGPSSQPISQDEGRPLLKANLPLPSFQELTSPPTSFPVVTENSYKLPSPNYFNSSLFTRNQFPPPPPDPYKSSAISSLIVNPDLPSLLYQAPVPEEPTLFDRPLPQPPFPTPASYPSVLNQSHLYQQDRNSQSEHKEYN